MRPREPLPSTAEVVVIGGGVIGTSVAFHLAEAGVGDVLLLERDELGSGSTGKAAGGVRAQFSDAVNVQIALRSLRAFDDFARRPGGEIDYHRVGYLFALDRAEDVARFSADVELQNALGVPSEMLSAEQAFARCPLLAGDDVLGAAFCPIDGHVTPDAVVQGYAAGARALGARVRTHCAVTGIELRDGHVAGVVTGEGTVACETVVCAAGAWSGVVAAWAGVALPVTPLRRQILFTEPIGGLPVALPMTIDFSTSFYFHREGPGLLVGMSDPDEQPGFHLETTDAWVPRLLDVAARRAPVVADAGIRSGWAGLYEMTPDHNALIGEADGVTRLLYATGFSGHGFLQGPGVGEIVRDLYLRREPVVDVSGLSVRRFAESELRPELNVV